MDSDREEGSHRERRPDDGGLEPSVDLSLVSAAGLRRREDGDRFLAGFQGSIPHRQSYRGGALGEICLSYSRSLPPFYLAYAHETPARAHKQMGQSKEAALHLAALCQQLPLVKDQASRVQLATELRELE